MAQEKARGCGYRKVGGTYLVGEGIPIPCDRLPFVLDECPCCGFKPSFTRAIQRFDARYLETVDYSNILPSQILKVGEHRTSCRDPFPESCPICTPSGKYGLMFVGKTYYTPESFIKEAKEMGVSKRINKVPKWLKLGETWILLAHKEVPIIPKAFEDKGLNLAIDYVPAIFYAFKPIRIERLIWKSKATPEVLEALKEEGVTPVLIEDGDPDHGGKKA